MNNYDLNFKENPNYIKKSNPFQKGKGAKENISEDLFDEEGIGNDNNENPKIFQKDGLFRKKVSTSNKKEKNFGDKEEAENNENVSESKGKGEKEKKNKV